MVKSLSVSGSLLRLGLRTGMSKFFVNDSTGQWKFEFKQYPSCCKAHFHLKLRLEEIF